MEQQTIKVYELSMNGSGSKLVSANLDDIIEYIKQDVMESADGDEIEASITISKMPEDELKNLPEFDGF